MKWSIGRSDAMKLYPAYILPTEQRNERVELRGTEQPKKKLLIFLAAVLCATVPARRPGMRKQILFTSQIMKAYDGNYSNRQSE
jgi:hypothetical protein